MSERYLALAHAMQSGVAYDIEKNGVDGAAANPKHLRTGVNSAMVEHSSLAWVLIQKGIITEAEYIDSLEKGMEAEVERYELKADPDGRIKFA